MNTEPCDGFGGAVKGEDPAIRPAVEWVGEGDEVDLDCVRQAAVMITAELDDQATDAAREQREAEAVAVFLDGCFWHSCPEHGTTPHANREWWVEKLRANFERDRRHDRELTAAGWLALRFWEHEEPATVVDAIERHVRSRRVRE